MRGETGRRVAWVPMVLVALLIGMAACTRQSHPDDRDAAATAPTETSGSTAETADADGSAADRLQSGADGASGPITTAAPVDPAWLQPLELDPAVIKGTLDNGLTYYLMENDAPGGRAELRLAIDAGSVLETDDQLGMAHFLEHMMFNGTERFPRNELTAVLESFGPRFGPDINAYTSYDETVYQLSLPADDDLLDLGVQVLGEWAARATITDVDVREERGVVLDEWRLRDQGLSGRLFDTLEELLLVGTPYAGRAPIGTGPSIESAEASVLRDFYDTWYRPELIAVVAVGDFDLEDMEDRIRSEFEGLQGGSGLRPELGDFGVADGGALALADPELVSGSLDVTWLRPIPDRTDRVLDFRTSVIDALVLDMFATRLNDDALRGDVPLISAAPDIGTFGRHLGIAGVTAATRPDELEAGLTAVLQERARIIEFGFSADELDQALNDVRAASDQARNTAETRQDAELAAALVAHHLEGSAVVDPDAMHELEHGLYDGISLAEVNAHFSLEFSGRPFVRALGPDDPEVTIPSDTTLAAIIDRTDWQVTPRVVDGEVVETLMEPPDPSPAARVETDPNYGFRRLTYDNGAEVVLWPTTISENNVYLKATSWGGTSVVAVEDLVGTEVLTQVVQNSGVGAVDAVALDRFLTGRIALLDIYLGETTDVIEGASATEDLETLLQLVHLNMTAPRVDQVALGTAIDENRDLYGSIEEIPAMAVFNALQQAYYGDDPRYALPSPGEFDAVDQNLVTDLLVDRFGDAGDFIFVFVGDFDPDTAQDLAATYIGSLSSSGERETFVDNQPLPAREVQRIDLAVGTDPEGTLSMYFTNPHDYSLHDELALDVLAKIINARLRDRIREELGASYSPFTSIDLQREPDPFTEAFIEITGEPGDLERLSEEVVAALSDLQTNGPTQAEFDTAIEQMRTELELISNPELADAVIDAWFYPDQPVLNLSFRYDEIETVTMADMQRLARIAYNLDQRIEVRLGPE